MDSLTLDQLTVFQQVVEAGSFSAAARQLHRAQSAISHAVASLERNLDVTLFDRRGRTPVLTEAGTALLADARAISRKVAILRARARDIHGGVEARVSIVVNAMYPMPVLLSALAAFREQFPTVTVHLRTENLGAIVDALVDGSCQVGVGGPMWSWPDSLEREAIGRVLLVPVAAPTHPLAAFTDPIAPNELRDHMQIVLTDRSPRTEGSDAGVYADETWRVADLSAKHECLRAGFGWGSMPVHVVQDDLDAGRLVRLSLDAPENEIAIPLYAIHRRADPPGPASRWLLDALRLPRQQGVGLAQTKIDLLE